MEDIIRVTESELFDLIQKKLHAAGLTISDASEVAKHLVYADARGVHSHGAVRVEYYAERISKGGTTTHPNIQIEEKTDNIVVIDGDNATGFSIAQLGIQKAIEIAKKTGVAIVGMKRMGHCGTLSYYLEQVAKENLVGFSMCQSDPMVVPFGGAEPYFGTNPFGFSAPTRNGQPIVFDMATTVQAWGKVLDARAKNLAIPDNWAVDKEGMPTTDPFAISGLVPMSGAKGYGLMMMIDILCGSMLGVPFGKHVSSMYDDLTKGRELGQLHIVIDPSVFNNMDSFLDSITQMITELHEMKTAPGVESVLYPGEPGAKRYATYEKEGIPIVKEIYDYLISDEVNLNRYDHKGTFA